MLLLISLITLFAINSACNQQAKLTPEEAKTIAKEAYIYGFPMVMGYKLMYAYTLDENNSEYKGPFNSKGCQARLYTPKDKAVVTPNSDTPYCMSWMDIRKEPLIISVPDMETERFYHFQLTDLYSHNFAYIGTLTTGNNAGRYMVVSLDWQGEKPDGIDKIIFSETPLFFIVVRTQLMGQDDLNKVKTIQDSYEIQTLSEFLGGEAIPKTKSLNTPIWNEGDQFTSASFAYFDALLDYLEPVDEEKELWARFAKIGLGAKGTLNLASFEPEIQEAINSGVEEGFEEIEEFIKQATTDPLASAKVFGTREFLMNSAKDNYKLEDFYILRAAAAHIGLYGNSGAEAIYPTYLLDEDGAPIDASQFSYTLNFAKGELPPVKAFWSLTMYDGKTQLLVDNPLNKYLLNSPMLADFIYNEDGSLSLYIQKDTPGTELETNWLPAPDGPFYMVLRLYGPEDAALKGDWVNPPLIKN